MIDKEGSGRGKETTVGARGGGLSDAHDVTKWYAIVRTKKLAFSSLIKFLNLPSIESLGFLPESYAVMHSCSSRTENLILPRVLYRYVIILKLL